MWGNNSISPCYQSSNKLMFDQGKNNYSQNAPNANQSELNLLCQTPIKQFENIQNNNSEITPFRFDFNYYFGNLWSAGKMPNPQMSDQNINLSMTQMNKENLFFYKKSVEKSYKISPLSPKNKSNSQTKNNNNSNKSLGNYNNVVILNQNFDNNSGCNTIIKNELTKKNLEELFNNAKNEQFLYDTKKRKPDVNHINKNKNINCNKINEIRRKNCNLQISHEFIFSSPRTIKKPQKIFECSGSTVATNYSNKNFLKKRRFRKNNEQLTLLKKFYKEHKHWSKSQIIEISQKIGLKENKVYKWLWDQRNKEIKATKFVIKKGNNS